MEGEKDKENEKIDQQKNSFFHNFRLICYLVSNVFLIFVHLSMEIKVKVCSATKSNDSYEWNESLLLMIVEKKIKNIYGDLFYYYYKQFSYFLTQGCCFFLIYSLLAPEWGINFVIYKKKTVPNLMAYSCLKSLFGHKLED